MRETRPGIAEKRANDTVTRGLPDPGPERSRTEAGAPARQAGGAPLSPRLSLLAWVVMAALTWAGIALVLHLL